MEERLAELSLSSAEKGEVQQQQQEEPAKSVRFWDSQPQRVAEE